MSARYFIPSSICFDTRVPIEPRILLDQVGGGFVAELPIAADFLEFVEESVGLLRIERIAELADEVGGLDEPRLQTGPLRVPVGPGRKAGELDRLRHPLGIDERRVAEPLIDEEFRPVDMISRKRSVRGAARQLHGIAVVIDDELGLGVAAQHAANETDVVQKTSHDEMAVVLRLDALRHGAAEQNIAADRGHQDGMLEVVVEGVAPAEAFDRDPSKAAYALGQIVVRRAEDFAEVVGDEPAELLGRHRCDRVHCHTPQS